MPNRKEHPQSTTIRGWLLSDPIIQALPEAGAYATYATEQDAAWQATAAASRDGARVMTLRHRGNRGRFVYIAAIDGLFHVTPFDRLGFEAALGQYTTCSEAISYAVELGFWHLSNGSLDRLTQQEDWAIGTEQKRLVSEYLTKGISLQDLVSQMPVEQASTQSAQNGEAACLPNSVH